MFTGPTTLSLYLEDLTVYIHCQKYFFLLISLLLDIGLCSIVASRRGSVHATVWGIRFFFLVSLTKSCIFCNSYWTSQKYILYSSERVAHGFWFKGLTSTYSSKVGKRKETVMPPFPTEEWMVNYVIWGGFWRVFVVVCCFLDQEHSCIGSPSGFWKRGEILRTVALH